MDSDKRTNKAIEQKRPPTPILPLHYDPETETFKAPRFPSDWKTSTAASSWKCPQGHYEVYAKLSNAASSIALNGTICVGTLMPLQWYPAYIFGTVYVLTYNITGEIGSPGMADTVLAMTADPTVSIASKAAMASQGWILSEGDTLTASISTMIVRYRRIS